MRNNKIVILLVEDNKDFARLVDLYLNRYENNKFEVIWKENGPSALKEAENNKDLDIVLMDYFLPGMNGLEITKSLQEKRINLPVVFLTVNKDFELAIQVMKLRVEDYLVKEEITSPVLPKTILEVLEKHKLQSQLLNLEIKQKRIEAMQSIVSDVVKNISEPLLSVGKNIELLKELENLNETRSYFKIIKDNYARILLKFEKIRTLKQDKTITYIKGINMIDLS